MKNSETLYLTFSLEAEQLLRIGLDKDTAVQTRKDTKKDMRCGANGKNNGGKFFPFRQMGIREVIFCPRKETKFTGFDFLIGSRSPRYWSRDGFKIDTDVYVYHEEQNQRLTLVVSGRW